MHMHITGFLITRLNYDNRISSAVYFDLEGSIQGLNPESMIRSGQVTLRFRMACGIRELSQKVVDFLYNKKTLRSIATKVYM